MPDIVLPTDALILGAGPAGLSAALELSRAGKHITVVEKKNQVGGLAKTYVFHEQEGIYRTDNGPHRFFSKNKYLYEMIEDILGERWMEIPRLTRFFVDGKFYYYPVRFRNVLTQMGLWKSFRVLFDYLFERIRAIVHPRKIQSFEDYAVTAFGRTLAEFNMLNYTEKIWGISTKQISVDWASQRIAGLSFITALRKMLLKKGGPKSLVDSFYYPDHGSGLVYEYMRDRIAQAGNPVLLETQPIKIHWEGKHVKGVDLRGPDGDFSLSSSAYVSSVPAPHCVRLFDPPAPQVVLEAASKLRFRSQVYLFLTINRERVTRDNWIYFPNKHIPFGRISEMKNFSKLMCPSGKTSLFIEFFCFEGDAIWNASKEQLFDQAIVWLEKLQFIRRSDVLNVYHIRESNAYPVYDLEYSQHARVITEWLDSFENFYAVGRPGRFRYTNQDHSLEMGILAARSILEGKRYDIGAVGAGKEYFEKGYAPERIM